MYTRIFLGKRSVAMGAFLALAGSLLIPFAASAAVTTSTVTAVVSSASSIVASSQGVAVLGINAVSATTAETLNSVVVTLTQSAGTLTLNDLAALDTTAASGVAIYADNKSGGVAGTFDSTDTVVTAGAVANGGSGPFTVTRSSLALTIPANDTGANLGADYFVVIRTSATIANADAFTVGIAATGDVTYSAAVTTTVVTSAAITADTTAPTITVRATRDADSNGKIDAIRLTFSENMNDVFTGVTDTVAGYTVTSNTTGATATDTSTDIVFTEGSTSDTAATPLTQITVNSTLRDTALGGTAVTSAGGNPVGGNLLAVDGMTVASTDAAPPVLVTRSPLTGSGGVLANPAASIVATFSEAMTTASVTATTFTISPQQGAFVFSWASGNTVLTAASSSPYIYSSVITVTLTTAITAAAGTPNALVAVSPAWTFTTTGAPSSSSGGGGYSPPVAVVSLSVSAPNGGERVGTTAASNITWTSSGSSIANIRISLSSDSGFSFPTVIAATAPNTGTYSWTPASTLAASTYRVRVEALSSTGAVLISDISDLDFRIMGTAAVVTPPPVVTPPVVTPPPATITAPHPTAITSPVATPGLSLQSAVALENGDLIRAQGSTTVYVYTSDGYRHAFFSELHFKTWYSDFSNVKTIPASQLAAITLGKNMRVRSGTWLIKIQSDPKVYAVEPGGIIRWVSSEAVAQALYGSQWAHRVIDVDVSRFVDYYIGAPITDKAYPTGSIISDDTGTYYVQNGMRRRFTTPEVMSGMGYLASFTLPVYDITAHPNGSEMGALASSTGPRFGVDGLELTPP